jgi:hypothetical protein
LSRSVARAAYRSVLYRSRPEVAVVRIDNYQVVKVSKSEYKWQLLSEA